MLRIGVAGIGKISGVYLDNLTRIFGKRVKLTALCDVISERAEKAAASGKYIVISPSSYARHPNLQPAVWF